MFTKASFDPAPAVVKASPPSPSDGQLPARTSAGPPLYVDKECDIELPRRLFATIIVDGRPREIVRALTEEERGKLTARATELRAGLAPFGETEAHKIDAAIGAMFGGFRAMRQEGENVEAQVDITRFVLREFPRWAIEEGCLKIAQGKAGLEKRYAPNDTQIHEVIAWIVRPYSEKARVVHALLTAPVEPPLARRTLGQATHVSGHPHGAPREEGHTARALADLAARKAGRSDKPEQGEPPCPTP